MTNANVGPQHHDKPPAKTNSAMATWALVLGILAILTSCIGIGLMLGLIAIGLGIAALVQINNPENAKQGQGKAIAGIVTGGTSILLAPILLAFMIGLAVPVLSTGQRTARMMQDSTQLRALHQSLVIEAQRAAPDSNGNRPQIDDIGELYAKDKQFGLITGDRNYFLSPATAQTFPADFDTLDLEAQKDWIRRHSDYILVPGLVDDADVNQIALFLLPSIYSTPPDRRGNVTYNDGSSSFETDWNAIEAQLVQQTGMTTDELIERQRALADKNN